MTCLISQIDRPLLLALSLMCTADWAGAQTATLRPDGSRPEDPALRAEAVRLLERANHVSIPSVWPPNEMTLRFRVATPAAGDPYEGEYVNSAGGPALRRQHWHYGAYDFTLIRNGQRVVKIGSPVLPPTVLSLLTALSPIYLIRFDNQDLIRSIADSSPETRCIAFDTIAGQRVQANEVCVDTRNGWLLSVRVGDTVTRNSNFFPFQGAFLPGHVERWSSGQKVLEFDETLVPKSDYPADFFTVPDNSPNYICEQFRRAFEVNTPQPPAGPSDQITDIHLQGLIDAQGRARDLRATETSRPDLNEESIKLVSTWTYQPATCNGTPVMWGATFTVHFVGR